jgi:hemoglobin
MSRKDVLDRSDVADIVARFYDAMLKDPVVGFIFTDITKIDLDHHLPIIVDFWCDNLFAQKIYKGNTLQKHLDVHQKISLRPGHFTRWLFLFSKAVNRDHEGENAVLMIERAERVAASIAAALVNGKRSDQQLVL